MASNYERTHGVTTLTAATLAVDVNAHVGQPIVISKADGATVTLPAATGTGNKYEFIGGVTATSDHVIQVTGDDVMAGLAILGSDATPGVGTCFYAAADSDTITLDGTTTGGVKGYRVECRDIAANTWAVLVISEASGTEATPFSAAVS